MKSKNESRSERIIRELRQEQAAGKELALEAADTIEELAALASELQQQVQEWEQHQREINDAVETYGSYRP
jgi:hypothetical protein